MKKRLNTETVKALIIVSTYFKNLSCAEFHDQILNEKEILEQVHKSDKYFSN
jgi:peptidoglycan hydrolase CwlO-like protein